MPVLHRSRVSLGCPPNCIMSNRLRRFLASVFVGLHFATLLCRTHGEVKVKTTRKHSTLATRIILALLFVFTASNSQTFDLLSAKSTDKVAQSKFFEIDSNKVLNEYNLFAFNSPVSRIYDSVFEVAGIHAAVSAVNGANAEFAKRFFPGSELSKSIQPVDDDSFQCW